jgi:hypothetical protein
MSFLRVVCANPRCQKILRIQARQVGQRIRCPACRAVLIAPGGVGSAAGPSLEADTDDAAIDAPPPLWMTVLYWLGLLAGLFMVLVAVAGFEVFLMVDRTVANQGATAELLTGATWKIAARETKQAATAEDVPVWWNKGNVWTFHANGRAETGRLREGRNRYERKPASGFRTWHWTTQGDQLTLTSEDEPQTVFVVGERPKDKLALTPVKGDSETTLVLAKTEPVETFPDLRVVGYGGVLAPMLVTFLLAWLISREVFHSGCLRFAAGWPLTVMLGAALGAGAGFLLDMLNDYSHGTAPYWMILSFGQAALGVVVGFALAVLSCLRPT